MYIYKQEMVDIMILNYKVSNYKSISDPISLNFVANKYEDQTQYEPYFLYRNKRILKGIGIFGANASGKSNVLDSLSAFANTILQTANFSEHQTNDWIIPFAFSNEDEKPTTFELCFLFNATRYTYHLSLTKSQIVEEGLSFSPNGRSVPLFHRHKSSLDVNEHFVPSETKKLIADRNIPNKPIVTFAAQFNIPYLKDVYAFVLDNLIFANGLSNAYEQGIGNLIDKDPLFQIFLVSLMKAADLSIDDVGISKTTLTLPFVPYTTSNQVIPSKQNVYKVFTSHVVAGKTYKFGLESESWGTLKLMAASSALFNALKKGALLIFDEFGSSLHPDLAKFMLSLFFDSSVNKRKSQLLFATHNTRLLNEMILRRDEIYVSEKDRKNKSTHLYPLSEFSVRKKENIEHGFLNGRYVNPPDIDEWEINIE